jgi:hypothetical protein
MPVETSGGNEEEKGLIGLVDESKGGVLLFDSFVSKIMNYWFLSVLLAIFLSPVSILI